MTVALLFNGIKQLQGSGSFLNRPWSSHPCAA